MTNKLEYAVRKVVLLRHGESVWNKENRFTGWTDVDLSKHDTGIPLVYELDKELHPIRHYYLGDAARVKKAIRALEGQASAKHRPE
jgi:2,3-bisphosphoglycerate-dependent phosphoglycerate mutase